MIPTRTLLPALALAPILARALPPQTPPEVDGPLAAGYRTVTVAGQPGGNASVALLVYYPATVAGANTPLLPSGAPYPLVVFGHGFSLAVSLYDTLFRHLATRGFVCAGVATEEGLLTGNLPRYLVDLRAAVLGLRQTASDPQHPLHGGIAADARAVAAGHSFGGAAALVAASGRADLFAGVVSLAATSTSPQGVDILAAVRALTVPALHLGASQDGVVPPPQNLDPIYQATPGTRILVEIRGGIHSYFHERWGIDRLTEVPGPISVAEQQRIVRRAWLPFLTQVLRGEPDLLDYLLGPTAVADTSLSRRQLTLADALLFGSGSGAIGTVYTLCPARTPGDAGAVFAAAGTTAIATPFGVLRLDPVTLFPLGAAVVGAPAFATLPLAVPNDPSLHGASLPTQALLAGSSVALSNLALLRIP